MSGRGLGVPRPAAWQGLDAVPARWLHTESGWEVTVAGRRFRNAAENRPAQNRCNKQAQQGKTARWILPPRTGNVPKIRERDPWLVSSDRDWVLRGNLSGRSNTPAAAFDSQYH